MRLIDADKYMAHLKKWADEEWLKKESCPWWYALEIFMNDFEQQPTVDAVPREELLNTLNGRLDFLKKWRNETADFKNIATAMIEDCEDIIDIIKSLKENKDG
jgi:hypothetical protein